MYSVKSTGIYCRLSYPARLARRATVDFYKTPAKAESAGFRACERCKPEIVIMEGPLEQAVIKACALIEEAIQRQKKKFHQVAGSHEESRPFSQIFHKVFKDKVGMIPKGYEHMRQRSTQEVDAVADVKDGQNTSGSFEFDGLGMLGSMEFNRVLTVLETYPPKQLSRSDERRGGASTRLQY